MKTPISAADLADLAPHRPPMRWIDQILDYGPTHGECSLTVQADAHYMSKDGLRPSSCVEFIAQAYALISICQRAVSGDPVSKAPKRAFLASIKDARFNEESVIKGVRAGDIVHVKITGARQLGPITLLQGRVTVGDQWLCESQLKVFAED